MSLWPQSDAHRESVLVCLIVGVTIAVVSVSIAAYQIAAAYFASGGK